MRKKVVILGGGPAGYSAAIRCAQLGGEVKVLEKENLGGICLNHGCIPTKVFVEAANLIKEIKNAGNFSIEAEFKGIKWAEILNRKNEIVKKLTGGVAFLFQHYGIEWIKEEGKLTREGIAVGEKILPSDTIILATGSSSLIPKELFGERVLTHREALMLTNLPEKIAILGGGANGCEFAHIFSSFGVDVTLVEMMNRLLPLEDSDISREVENSLREEGVKIYTSHKAYSLKEGKSGISCKIGEEEWEGDYILLSIGRKQNTDKFSEIGIKVEKKGVIVDNHLRTSIPEIYAAGDILPTPQFAHVAYKEGRISAENAMGKEKEINYGAIPRVIFTSPESASVGMTEEKVKEKNIPYKTAKFPFRASGKAMSEGNTKGWVKIIMNKETEEILGFHIFSLNAGELLNEITLAMNLESTPEEIKDTIHPHPTRAESIQEVCELILGEPLHFIMK